MVYTCWRDKRKKWERITESARKKKAYYRRMLTHWLNIMNRQYITRGYASETAKTKARYYKKMVYG